MSFIKIISNIRIESLWCTIEKNCKNSVEIEKNLKM